MYVLHQVVTSVCMSPLTLLTFTWQSSWVCCARWADSPPSCLEKLSPAGGYRQCSKQWPWGKGDLPQLNSPLPSPSWLKWAGEMGLTVRSILPVAWPETATLKWKEERGSMVEIEDGKKVRNHDREKSVGESTNCCMWWLSLNMLKESHTDKTEKDVNDHFPLSNN